MMKKITLLLVLVFAVNLTAQTQYEKGMNKAFQLWGQQKNTEASQLFERIANAEKDKWLPSYYAGLIEVLGSFGIKDEAKLKAKLNKAQEFLDNADAISPNNPEVLITKAFLNVSYMAFDGQKYGMTMSMKNNALYARAIKIAPNNPRVIMSKAEADMGAARFFGKPITPYCKDIERAVALAKKEKITEKFYPQFGFDRATQILKQCKQ
jgi:hypothetical protein